jgi:hypothetical protein
MAYEFNGTNQYLTVASAPATAAPLTIAAWFRKSGTATKNGIFLRATANNIDVFGFYFGASSSVRGYTQAVGGFSDFAASGSYSTNTWGHACFVEASAASRTIYRNGGNSATNTDSRTPAGINQLEIAHFGGATTFDGQFAEVGIWNAALTAAEVASLADGMTCDKVRPQSLVFYAPLVRNLQDIKGGLTITNNNTATVAAHPRVYA